MSGYRKKFSGAEYRKRKAEESRKIDSLLKKNPKISSFMTSLTGIRRDFRTRYRRSTVTLFSITRYEQDALNFPLSQDTEEIQSTTDIIKFNTDPFLWNLNEET
ncbi:unnamed protein product [Psylliodes chrysocephalus]|uniref:Uncharacterized protein n=1 Tax=Psylliodes chrysocephalus TaxID=3402493 RepID=A0A9P0D1R7_9CUCU|nr:unnamed protein product [Psylliodes chrysocephala]